MSQLARVLNSPSLARIVPHLTPETLHQIVRHCGLEACGELVTSATPAQLTSLLDMDLWQHARPGHEEQFDVDRFGEWLDVLVDAGDSVAARVVSALDVHMVVAGLSRYVRVFDPGTFEPHESSDDEAIDRHDRMNSEAGTDLLECELDGFLVRARRTDAWDAIVAVLVTLDAEHNDYFQAVMQECRRLSNSRPEIDGLDDLLMAPEQHLHDVAIEREQRRSRQGYATPGDACAFLQMARQPQRAINPIAAAYFRAADEATSALPALPSADADIPSSVEAVIELLAEAGLMPDRSRALLGAPDEDPRASQFPVLRRLMKFATRHDDTAYFTRSRELAFIANALVAGCSVQSRPFTPQEASDAAGCICNLGLECSGAPDDFLVDHDLVTAFEAGWSRLYQDVSLFVADQLISVLDTLESFDDDASDERRRLQRKLMQQRDAGTPWLARDAADVLAALDTTAWISVLGLLSECPVLPETLTAVLEGRATSVSPTAFEFISTLAQIRDIRTFMTTLPGQLS